MKIHLRCEPALLDLLPAPVPAREVLPAWLRAMAPRVPSELQQRPIRSVKRCPPFVDAMSHGPMALLPCGVQVQRGGRFQWHWDVPRPTSSGHPRAPLGFHVPEQLSGTPMHDPASSAIRFNSLWTIELKPGWALFATHPVNREDLPFRTLSGLVDSDRFVDAGINFPALWTAPDAAQRYADTVAQVLAEPGVYRKRFRVKRPR